MNTKLPEQTVIDQKINYIQSPVKRIFDFCLAVALFIILSPFFILFSIIVKLDGGSAFYGHERIGKNGKKFKCLKFRSKSKSHKRRFLTSIQRNPQP